MSLTDKFNAASAEVANFKTVDDPELYAYFYSHYKQATAGDCNLSGPASNDAKDVAKYNAWSALKGTSKDAAMEGYIKKYEEKKGSYKK